MKEQKKFTFITSLMMITAVVLVPKVSAEDIAVTNNGAESSNQVSIISSNRQAIQSSNNADIKNTVNTNASTGNNTSSDNNASTSTKTGDIKTSTDISNTANSSTVKQECCPTNGSNSVEISNNGKDSQNNIQVNNSQSTNVTINNTATITNTVSTHASTGNNTANDNGGSVVIRTGDIDSSVKINNKPVNLAEVKFSKRSDEGYDISISGNGAYSSNDIDRNNKNKTDISIDNVANIITELKQKLETGDNKANDNNGDVRIFTGDILSKVAIENAVNVSKVVVEPCEEKKEKEAPAPQPSKEEAPPPAAPPPPAKAGEGVPPSVSAGVSSVQQVAAAAVSMLPITGNDWFFFAMFANVIMLLFGAYLRLRSGRSPSALSAFLLGNNEKI